MKLKEKYPEEYFEHWIVMLSTMNTDLNLSGFKGQIKLYIEFEGVEEFEKLKNEVKEIKKNNDINKFIEVVKTFDIDNLNEDQLIEMANVIINE